MHQGPIGGEGRNAGVVLEKFFLRIGQTVNNALIDPLEKVSEGVLRKYSNHHVLMVVFIVRAPPRVAYKDATQKRRGLSQGVRTSVGDGDGARRRSSSRPACRCPPPPL